MGIIVKVKTVANPNYAVCSWYACIHNRDMECKKEGDPQLDDTGQCPSREYPKGEKDV